jgi:hypothetical protein
MLNFKYLKNFERFLFAFETGSHYITQAGLELSILQPLPPGAGITGMYHHTQLRLFF